MKLRRRKLVIAAGIVFVLFAALAYAFHFRVKWAVAHYKRQLLSAGEKLSVIELILPRSAADLEMARVLLSAISNSAPETGALYTNWPSPMRLVAPGKAMVRWKQSEIRSESGTNVWSELDGDLVSKRGALAELRRISDHPALDFGIEYGQDFDQLKFLHLARFKSSAQWLSSSATAALHRNDPASAVTDVRAMLAIVKGTGQERFVISQLVRIAVAHIAFNATWELLQSPGLTEEQLAPLQEDWTAMDFVGAAEDALLMERATGQLTLAVWRKSPERVQRYVSFWADSSGAQTEQSRWDRIKTGGGLLAWRLTWSYSDELRELKGEQILLEAIRQVRTNYSFHTALAEQETRLIALFKLPAPASDGQTLQGMFNPTLPTILSQSALSLSTYLKRIMVVETARQLAVTAISLKRYQLRHGNYPSDLGALVPEFLQSVPRDPADGQPIRYRLNADGTFVLYSIGPDGVDDHGDPAPPASAPGSGSWQRGRDLVWPEAASESEIETFERRFASEKN